MIKAGNFLLSMILCSGISYANSNDLKIIEDLSAKNYLEVENLIVNVENGKRTFARKTRAEGIEDLIALSNSSKFEEAWAFIPSENLWLEIGVEQKLLASEKNDYLSPALAIDLRYLIKLSETFDTLEICHIHPRNIYGEYDKTNPFPSIVDFQQALFFENIIKFLGIESNLDYCLVSRFASFNFGLSSTVKQRKDKLSEKEFDEISDRFLDEISKLNKSLDIDLALYNFRDVNNEFYFVKLEDLNY